MKWWRLIVGYGINEFAPDKDTIQAWRDASECAGCPSLISFNEDDIYDELPPMSKMVWQAPPKSHWCGKPGVKIDGIACGCLVLAQTEVSTLTVNGLPVEPAGKTTKEGFGCPRGRFSGKLTGKR